MFNWVEEILFRDFLGKGEKLYYAVHRHWVLIYKDMIKIAFIGFILPLSIYFLFLQSVPIISPIGLFFTSWILMSVLWTSHTFFDWYLDAWLITDTSIIDVRWDGFFKKRSNRIDYNSIESINYTVKGFKQSLLGYGQIILTKASGTNVIDYVISPREAAAQIGQACNIAKNEKNDTDADAIKQLLAEVIEEHIRVKMNP